MMQLMSTNDANVPFWLQMNKKNEIITYCYYIETYYKIRQKLYSQYVVIKLLIANNFRLLFTYNSLFDSEFYGLLRRVSLFELFLSTGKFSTNV